MEAGVIVRSAVQWMDGASAGDARGTAGAIGPVGAVVHERRREPRRSGINEHGIYSARVRPGIDARLLDISAEGASIESTYRLLPGRRLILQLKFAACGVAIRGSVLRCTVFQASADRI